MLDRVTQPSPGLSSRFSMSGICCNSKNFFNCVNIFQNFLVFYDSQHWLRLWQYSQLQDTYHRVFSAIIHCTKHSFTLGKDTLASSLFLASFSSLHLQALMRTLLRSVRPYHQLPRKREKRRERKGSWRSKRCWFSTWKTQKHLPCKWKKQSLSSTPCYTGKLLQVQNGIHHLVSLVCFSLIFSHVTCDIFTCSGSGGGAVLCDSMRVQCCQLCQWSSEDVTFGLVDWCCH